MYEGSITDIAGIRVGCAEDAAARTGCTAVLFDRLMTAGVDVRGGGPGTINTDVLSPMTGGCVADCIMLAGGSAFGLEAAMGAMRWLEERGRGFETGLKRIPMVPGAIIYDLGVGDKNAHPDMEMGYRALDAAEKAVPQGRHGAGIGATVGKALLGKGMEDAGQGTAAISLGGGLLVGAIVVVNALGDVYEDGRILAGLRGEDGAYLDSMRMMEAGARADVFGKNTTIGVVATNARLSPAMTTRLSMIAHDGLAMSIRPVHTLADGDTVFGISTGEKDVGAEENRVLAAAAEAMRRAIVNAVSWEKERK